MALCGAVTRKGFTFRTFGSVGVTGRVPLLVCNETSRVMRRNGVPYMPVRTAVWFRCAPIMITAVLS